MDNFAQTAAHYLVLERLLARILVPHELEALKAECLGIEDNVYRRGGEAVSHETVQAMLAHVEGLFASAAQLQQEAGESRG